jgi:hypothetical protein
MEDSKMADNPDAKSFEALLDKMPGANNTLRVKGKVTVPTLGYKATLTEKLPPGTNPTILNLEVKKEKPSGQSGQQETKIDVSFQKPKSPDYEEVTIFGDGDSFTIPVKIVH